MVAAFLVSIAWLRADPAGVLQALTHALWQPLLASFLVLAAERVVTVLKLHLLLRSRGWRATFWTTFQIYWSSNLLGLFLPTGVGLDVLNAVRIHRHGMPLATSTSAVTVDRAAGLAALGGLLCWGALLSREYRSQLLAVAGTCALILLLALLFLLLPGRHLTAGRVPGFVRGLGRRIRALQEALLGFRNYPRALTVNLTLSLLMQLLRVLEVAVMAGAFGHFLGIRQALVVIPATNAITALPFTIGGGLGLRENAYLTLLPLVGIPPPEALALSVLVFAWVVLWVSPSALLLLRERRDS